MMTSTVIPEQDITTRSERFHSNSSSAFSSRPALCPCGDPLPPGIFGSRRYASLISIPRSALDTNTAVLEAVKGEPERMA